MGKYIKAIKKENRFGEIMYVCSRCGMVFRKIKDFIKHINKSHPWVHTLGKSEKESKENRK